MRYVSPSIKRTHRNDMPQLQKLFSCNNYVNQEGGVTFGAQVPVHQLY